MKHYFILLSTLISVVALGQNDSVRSTKKLHVHITDSTLTGYISISAGVGIPAGIFSYDNAYVNNSQPNANGTSDYASAGGFAKTGANITITAIASLKRPGTSFMGQISYSQNPFDVQTYASNYTSYQNNYYATTTQLTNYSNSSYHIISVTGGMYMPILGQTVILGLRMMGGAFFCISPHIYYTGQATFLKINSTYPASDNIASATAISWAVTAALDARYPISDKLSAVASVGFYFCLPKLDTTETDVNGNINSIRIVCPVSLVNINAGLGYSL